MIIRSIHKPDTAPAGRRPSSTCQALECARTIPAGHLMCREHWFEIPPSLQEQIEESLRLWLGGKQNVRPYWIARLRGIIHVGRLHKVETGAQEARLALLEQAPATSLEETQ